MSDKMPRKVETQTFLMPINEYLAAWGQDGPKQWAEVEHIGGKVISVKLTPYQLRRLYETEFLTAVEYAAQTNYNDTNNLD